VIDRQDPEVLRLLSEIRRVGQKLSLVSHAPTQSYNVVMKGDDVPKTPDRWRVNTNREPWPHLGSHGGKSGDTTEPRGGIDRHGDFQVEYRQKSHLYFEHKLNRIIGNPKATPADLKELIAEAEQAHEDWIKTPVYKGAEPLERGSFRWKCAIADDDRDPETINRVYAMGKTISRPTIYRYRQRYRGLRKSS
jgi:hypothetical protein